MDTGNFSWGSEAIARKARIIDTVYNASNNELVRTKTLVKNAIISVDAAPFRQWYEAHYALPLGRKKGVKLTEADEALFNKKRSKKTQKKYDDRRKTAKVGIEELAYFSFWSYSLHDLALKVLLFFAISLKRGFFLFSPPLSLSPPLSPSLLCSLHFSLPSLRPPFLPLPLSLSG